MKITIYTNGSFSWFNKRTERNENIQSDLAKAIIALEKELAEQIKGHNQTIDVLNKYIKALDGPLPA